MKLEAFQCPICFSTQLKKEGLITTAYIKVKGKGRVNGYSVAN